MSKKSATHKNVAMTAENERILIKQQFDDTHPGPILHDFDVLLKFVSDHAPLKVSGVNNLLPLDVLVPLNNQLTHPIRLDLKRPQHKSFSNLYGLYLLLRATGLVYVEGRGKTQVLVVDSEAVASWNSLNPTERYFMLLETLMLRANPEIVGERYGRGFGSPQYLCLDFFKRFPAGEMNVAGDKGQAESLSYFPGYYLIALMDMFGVIALQDDAPERGKGWRILSIRKTAFGEALFRFLTLQFEHELEIKFNTFSDIEEEESPQIGCWQKIFQPYFPEWRNNLVLSIPAIQEGMYIFKISLGKVWRRIVFPGKMDLDDMASVILNAFQFDHDHLYEFIYKDRFGVKRSIHHPMLEETPFTDEVSVQEIPLRIGEHMVFFFDFGDCWQFDVQLEKIDPGTSGLKKAKILEEHGKPPAQYWNEEEEEEEEEWDEDSETEEAE